MFTVDDDHAVGEGLDAADALVPKEHIIDENIGRWEEVNDAVKKYSQGALESVTLYSIMEDPCPDARRASHRRGWPPHDGTSRTRRDR